MANTLNLGNGNWATKKDSLLGYNSENNNFKPLPFDFTRASSATVVNKAGLIETVGSGEPRIDYKDDSEGALLLEPQRTNSITYSNDFSQSIYGKINLTITANQGISPDGTQNANLLVPNSSVGNRYLSNNVGSNLKTNTVFLKKKELRYVNVGNAASVVVVDLENGTISSNSVSTNNFTIENYGNGWYRVSCYNTSSTNYQIQVFCGVDGSGSNIATNGTDGVYIYGFEIQNGSYPTSYIPTQGSTVTRVQETSANQSNNINNFGTSNFSLFIESYIKEGYNARLKKMQSWTSRGYGLYINSYGLRGRVYGDSQIDTSYVGIGSVINNSKNKALMVVDRVLNTITIYSNGVNVHSQSIASIAGDSLDNTSPLELQIAINIEAGLINDFRIYNTALTNQESIALTKI